MQKDKLKQMIKMFETEKKMVGHFNRACFVNFEFNPNLSDLEQLCLPRHLAGPFVWGTLLFDDLFMFGQEYFLGKFYKKLEPISYKGETEYRAIMLYFDLTMRQIQFLMNYELQPVNYYSIPVTIRVFKKFLFYEGNIPQLIKNEGLQKHKKIKYVWTRKDRKENYL